MEQITVRLAEETRLVLEEFDRIAEDRNTSHAEVIREVLNSREDVDDIRTEYEDQIDELEREIEYLKNQVERLQRTNLKILEERDRMTDLEIYVDECREWERASWFTRQKWKLFGRE